MGKFRNLYPEFHRLSNKLQAIKNLGRPIKSGMISCLNFRNLLVALLILLSLAFFASMFSERAANHFYNILEMDPRKKLTLLQNLGVGMGGVLVALQALASHRRAVAMEKAASAQAQATDESAKANLNIEQGQRQERMRNAIEHLGHMSSSVRLGGAYELFHLARETETLRQTALDILCAHIRQTTTGDEYRKKHAPTGPSEEIQSLLTLLFVEEHEVFRGFKPNLQGSCLNMANLSRARLEKANLEGALLQRTNLHHACLRGSILMNANLSGAMVLWADLSGALLLNSDFRGAILFKSRLRGSTIIGTKMQLADLEGVQFQGAVIKGAELQGARLLETQLQGIKETGIEGDSEGSFSLKFEENLNASIGKESDLSGVIFQGGLTKKEVNFFIKGVSEADSIQLQKRLLPHIGKPKSHKLPENSGAVTGIYTKEEAEKWIAEYQYVDEVSAG